LKISGFTIVRNAVKYDYPVLESIRSLLPLVDEMLVSVGNSEDGTMDLIRSIDSPKIRIMESVWDDALREGGRVLAEETNKALAAISQDTDWCFYLQADEVLHEQWIEPVRLAMEKHLSDSRVQGLLFDYLHFYGSYKYTGDSRTWYRREVRVIRNLPGMESYRDAQGFRFKGNKLFVKYCGASIYHYGWVKNPHFQQEKQKNFHRLWHSDEHLSRFVSEADAFDYSHIDSLAAFKGSHPAVMENRVSKCDWDFSFDPEKKKFSFSGMILYRIEKLSGIRLFEYRNFKLL